MGGPPGPPIHVEAPRPAGVSSDGDADRRGRYPGDRTDEDREPEAEEHDPDPARRELCTHAGEEERGREENDAEDVVRGTLDIRACTGRQPLRFLLQDVRLRLLREPV